MSEQKWTPGPWRAVESGDGLEWAILWPIPGDPDDAERFIAKLEATVPSEGLTADAHLIAAAPSLATALQSIIAEHDNIAANLRGVDPGWGDTPLGRAIAEGRRVLAEAEGEA